MEWGRAGGRAGTVLSPVGRSPDLQARSTSFSKSVCRTEMAGQGERLWERGCAHACTDHSGGPRCFGCPKEPPSTFTAQCPRGRPRLPMRLPVWRAFASLDGCMCECERACVLIDMSVYQSGEFVSPCLRVDLCVCKRERMRLSVWCMHVCVYLCMWLCVFLRLCACTHVRVCEPVCIAHVCSLQGIWGAEDLPPPLVSSLPLGLGLWHQNSHPWSPTSLQGGPTHGLGRGGGGGLNMQFRAKASTHHLRQPQQADSQLGRQQWAAQAHPQGAQGLPRPGAVLLQGPWGSRGQACPSRKTWRFLPCKCRGWVGWRQRNLPPGIRGQARRNTGRGKLCPKVTS